MKKKIVALSMALCSLATVAFSACAPEENDSETNAIVHMYNGGYGIAAFEKIAAAFNAEAENVEKGYTVQIVDMGRGYTGANVTSKLQGGLGTFDLVLTAEVSVYDIVDKGANYLRGYDCALEDLSDVYEATVEGEGVTVGDKMVDQFYEYNTFKGTQRSMTWATGPSGIAYRADFFEQNGWTIPRTTNELIELSNTMLTAGYTPYILSKDGNGYWYYSVLAWWRQMISDEEFNDFWSGVDTATGEEGPEAFRTAGRQIAFEELERVLAGASSDPEAADGTFRTDGHLHTDSGTVDAIETQMKFYDSNQKICMLANSDWMENEIKKTNSYMPGAVDVGIFKTPVTSEVLKEYLPEGGSQWRFEDIRDEQTLRAVITSIDEGRTSHEGVCAEDFAKLKKIRSYTGTEAQNHTAFVPVYANAKAVAKEFLKYVATNKALQIYYNEVGTFLPFDTSGLTVDTSTTFRQDIYKMSQNAHYVSTFDSKTPLFYRNRGSEFGFFMAKTAEWYIGMPKASQPSCGLSGLDYLDLVVPTATQWANAVANSK